MEETVTSILGAIFPRKSIYWPWKNYSTIYWLTQQI